MSGLDDETALMAAFRPGLNKLEVRYGSMSRAVYAAKFILASRLLIALEESDSHGNEKTDGRSLLRTTVRELSEHFMLNDSQIAQRVAGATPFYRNLRPSPAAPMPRRLAQIVRISGGEQWHGIGTGVYIYCLTVDGDIMILNHNLTVDQLLCGVTIDGERITHPMLLLRGEERVQCAGEVAFVRARGGLVSAIFSRGSGHFKPDALALARIELAAIALLGMESRNIFLVG